MSKLTAYAKFIEQALKYGFSLWGTPPTDQDWAEREGDDGWYRKGYPRTGVRFVDNGDGTITDRGTGLMWVKDPSQCGAPFGTPGSPAYLSWNDSIDACYNLSYAGHSDWRLPNVKELITLQNLNIHNPCIDITFFPNTVSTRYWSSTTCALSDSNAWHVDFDDGDTYFIVKTTVRLARPVRLGMPAG